MIKTTTIFFLILTSLFPWLSAQNPEYTIETNTMEKLEMTLYSTDFKPLDIKTGQGYFTRLSLEGWHASNAVGAPELPVKVLLVEIPLCGEALLRVVPGDFDIVEGEQYGVPHPLYPVQPSYSKSNTDPVVFQKSEEIYQTDRFYGHELATLEVNGILRDTRLATLYFSPVQYNPVTHQFKIYRSARVEITYAQADILGTLAMKRIHGNGLSQALQGKVVNPLTFSGTRDPLTHNPIKYLVVSHPMFRGYFDELVAWKRQKGFLVEVAYTDDPAVGTTTASIAAFIRSKYTAATPEDPAPSYLLLMGDVQQLPAFSSTPTSHVTDLYYATWTEGDILPDCYYGRMSAQTVEQLTPQIAKTLHYEQLLFEDASFLGRAALIAGTDSYWSQTYADGQVNYLYDNYVNSEYGFTAVYKHNYNCSSQAALIREEIGAGTGFANYTAHCAAEGWSEPAFKVTHIAALPANDRYGLMIGSCCQSSKFDDNECFAEAITRVPRKGAVAYIGASANTYWDEDYTWTIGARQTKTAHPVYDGHNLGAFDRLFHTHGEAFSGWHTTCGGIIAAGNLAVQASTSNEKTYYWEIYNLMGDPSLMPYLALPQEMEVDIPEFILPGSNSLEVTVAPHAYVALLQNQELIATAFADENGFATLEFQPVTDASELTVAASVQNYEHYFQTLSLLIPDDRFVYAETAALSGGGVLGIREQRSWDLTVKNIGHQDARNVYALLASESGDVMLLEDSLYIGDLDAGQEQLLPAVFLMRTADFVEDQTPVLFTITFRDHQGMISEKRIRFRIAAPKIIRNSFQCAEQEGDGNFLFEPGETVRISMSDKNIGHLGSLVEKALISQYTKATVSNPLISDLWMDPEAVGEEAFYLHLDSGMESPSFLPLYYRVKYGNQLLYDTIYLAVGEVSEQFESGNFYNYPWENNNYPWLTTSSNAYEGNYAARSANNLPHNQSSELKITLEVGYDDHISYYRKVSSELGYDFFEFSIDGTIQEELSGTVDWGSASFPVPAGTHTFSFKYSKDMSDSRGSDCAWIDQIYFPGQAPMLANDTVVEFPNHLAERMAEPDIRIYPNPAQEQITIISSCPMERVEVIDLQGRRLKSLEGGGLRKQSIALDELAGGIYLVRIVSDKNQGVVVKKIIKQ